MHHLFNRYHRARLAADSSAWSLGSRRGQWALLVALALAYAIVARLSVAPSVEHIAVFWPAAGLSVGVLIVLGRPAWIPGAGAVFAATLVAHLTTRSSLGATLTFALANTIECLAVAWIVERFGRERGQFERLDSVFVFFGAALLAAAIAAVPAALALDAFGMSTAPVAKLWVDWFRADAVGIVTVAPLVATLPTLWRQRWSRVQIAESLAAVGSVGVATAYTFGLAPNDANLPMVAPATALFPLFLWIGMRMRPVTSAAAILVFSLVLTTTIFIGFGRFGDARLPIADRIVAGQLAMITFSLCGLSLSATLAHLGNVVASLQASEERLRLGLNAGSVYVFNFDLVDGKVHRFGGLIERLGLPAVGKLGDYHDRVNPDDRDMFAALMTSLSPTTPSFSERVRLDAVDGDTLYIVHRAHATFDGDGRIVRLVGTCADVTQRHLSEQALAASEERLRNSLRMGQVFAFDWTWADGQVRRSDNAAEILGVSASRAQMNRVDFTTYVHPDDRTKFAGDVTALTPAAPVGKTEFRFLRPDGHLLWLEISQGATFDASGQKTRVSGLARDVTERKLAQERQGHLIDELNHRVKNSLARMSAVIARSREGHPSIDEYVAALEGRIMSMARTHQRLSANKWDGVSLSTLVRDELEPYRTAQNLVVEGVDIVLEADAAQSVSLTLHELATNAAKHGALGRADGRVAVRWQIDGGEAAQPMLRLTWQETSDRPIEIRQAEGFGVTTIRNLLAFELDATVTLAFPASGAKCDIMIPVERIKSRTTSIAGPATCNPQTPSPAERDADGPSAIAGPTVNQIGGGVARR